MSNLRNASLILKTSDLTANSITAVGEANQYMTKMTWYNVNLRTILGDMYDDYDQFNLCLNTFASALVLAGVGATLDDRQMVLKVAGIPFINQSYDVAKGHNSNGTYMGTIYYTQGQSSSQLFYGSNIATFGKNQDVCNITISYERILDGALPTTANAFPSSVFIFDIIGIDKKPTENAARMENSNTLNTFY